jgi:hypothetical protein
MLFCDAWFDSLSANDSGERLVAVALAFAVELPTSAACLLIARHVEEVAERAQRYAVAARQLRPRRHTGRRGSRRRPDPLFARARAVRRFLTLTQAVASERASLASVET